jgi:cytochrome c553
MVKQHVFGFLTLALGAVALACMSPSSTSNLSIQADIARGGLIYDKWYKTSENYKEPKTSHPAYPATSAYAKKPASNWRCKECHGWDYKGNSGVYAKGKHFTGISGIQSYKGKDATAITEILKNDKHKFARLLSKEDLKALVLFVSRGQFDMAPYIDPVTTKAKGDSTKGKIYYQTLCTNCHGDNGKKEDMPAMGPISRKNPWECLHKILNGQPDADMPALRALDISVSVDILSYLQTLED